MPLPNGGNLQSLDGRGKPLPYGDVMKRNCQTVCPAVGSEILVVDATNYAPAPAKEKILEVQSHENK